MVICMERGADLHISQLIGAGRILKVEGHSGGSNSRRKIFFGAPHFQLCPPSF